MRFIWKIALRVCVFNSLCSIFCGRRLLSFFPFSKKKSSSVSPLCVFASLAKSFSLSFFLASPDMDSLQFAVFSAYSLCGGYFLSYFFHSSNRTGRGSCGVCSFSRSFFSIFFLNFHKLDLNFFFCSFRSHIKYLRTLGTIAFFCRCLCQHVL